MEVPLVAAGRVWKPGLKTRLNDEALKELNQPSKRRKTKMKESVRKQALTAAAEPVYISSSPPIQSTQPRESNLSRTKSTRKSKPPPIEELPEVGEESDEVSDLLR